MAAQSASGLDSMLAFPLIEALHGRRARRFSMGAEIPDGRSHSDHGTSRCP